MKITAGLAASKLVCSVGNPASLRIGRRAALVSDALLVVMATGGGVLAGERLALQTSIKTAKTMITPIEAQRISMVSEAGPGLAEAGRGILYVDSGMAKEAAY